VTLGSRLVGERDVRGDERAPVRRTVDAKLAVESGDPIREPEETAPPGPGAPDTIVMHADSKGAVAHVGRDLGAPGAGVLSNVGQCLGHHEVRSQTPNPCT
jgi:hypothetical protein